MTIKASLNITSITPTSSSLAGGQLLTITGSGFAAGASSTTEVTVCGAPCVVVSSAADQCVCSTPSVGSPQPCQVDVSVITASNAAITSCGASADIDVASQAIASSSCPEVELIAVGAGSTAVSSTCSFSVGGTDVPLPASAAEASYCAVQLQQTNLAVQQIECFGPEVLEAAAGFVQVVNRAADGDVVMFATCGQAAPWRSTNQVLRSPFVTLSSSLAQEGSGATFCPVPPCPAGWWNPSKAGDAFAFVHRKSAGSLNSGFIAETTGIANATATAKATVECSHGRPWALETLDTPLLPRPFFGWGSSSHVAAVVAASNSSSAAASASSPTSHDVFSYVQDVDRAASAANASTASLIGWIVPFAREALVTLDLGSFRRIASVVVRATAESIFIAANDGQNDQWRAMATKESFSDNASETQLVFVEPVATRFLKIHLVAGATASMAALRSVRVIGCTPSTDATPDAAVTYSSAFTPQLQQVTPLRGRASGGTKVTITGSGFGDKQAADVTVRLAGIECAVDSYTDSGALQEVVCTSGVHGGFASGLPWAGAVTVIVHGLGAAIVPDSSATFQYINLWSETLTWGSQGFPIEGDTVFIPIGQTVLLDLDPPRLYFVVVQGHLEFDRIDINLDANFIFILDGSFTVGTEERRATEASNLEMPDSSVVFAVILSACHCPRV